MRVNRMDYKHQQLGENGSGNRLRAPQGIGQQGIPHVYQGCSVFP
jgi:hypothetical protein